MTDFDPGRHWILGDAATATSWIDGSTLPDDEKAALRRFVGRFPSLRFARADDALLDHFEQVDEITLPPWFRASLATLAGVEPMARVRVDAFTFEGSPREEPGKEYYELSPAYINGEIRELLHDGANVYLIGQWFGTDRSCLAVDLADPADRRIVEFAMEDLYDDDIEGRDLRDSLKPVFSSYADLLGHVVEVRRPDGDEISATS